MSTYSGKTILSVQSHVAYGYVGNRAAVPPLQLRGHEVIIVNTVQFSNHTGYDGWTGQVFATDEIAAILDGLAQRSLLGTIDAVLTGYIGSGALGDTVMATLEHIRAVNPAVIYTCDPVMGDEAPGFYTGADIHDFFKNRALPQAGIITPNTFELTALTGINIDNLADARAACQAAHQAGPDIVLLTSLMTAEIGAGMIGMMVSQRGGEAYLVTTPMLEFETAPNGAGDLCAALYLAHHLEGNPADKALAATAASVYGILRATRELGQRELALIPALGQVTTPTKTFAAHKL